MKIYLAAYPRGVHRITESLEPGDLDLDAATFRSPVLANLTLDRHDPYLEFRFDLSTKVIEQCDRCASDFEHEVRVVRPMIYVLGRTVAQRGLDDDQLGVVPAGATELDLTTDLRDYLILSLPDRKLCREDCRGLCPMCGANLNIESCTCGSITD